MDCKHESAVRTLIRIEALAIQGVLYSAVVFCLAVIAIPLVPFSTAVSGWRHLSNPAIKHKLIRLPLWFGFGILAALSTPFILLAQSIRNIWQVSKTEWVTRWTTGLPKRADGKPAYVLSQRDKDAIDLAVTVGVLKDYNEDAKALGDGLPLTKEEIERSYPF